MKPLLTSVAAGAVHMAGLRGEVESFVAHIAQIVRLVEANNARNIAILRYMQFGLIALALVGTVALIYMMFLLVVRPVASLAEGMQRMAAGEFGARLPVETRDEFGDLAEGFNRMASRLQDVYATLEERVADKTRDLGARNRELAALYEVARLLNEPVMTEELCRGFLRRLMALHGAADEVGGGIDQIAVEDRALKQLLRRALQAEGEGFDDRPVDSDGDCVPDGLDKCPHTSIDDPSDESGCTAAQRGEFLLPAIRFEPGSTTVTAASAAPLEELASMLKQNPDIIVEIGGHTDNEGPASVNRTISLERAEEVKAYLVTQGVSASRLVTKGYGEVHPIASNRTAGGRAQNRRIEFKVLPP